jgi:hypothetical protein
MDNNSLEFEASILLADKVILQLLLLYCIIMGCIFGTAELAKREQRPCLLSEFIIHGNFLKDK